MLNKRFYLRPDIDLVQVKFEAICTTSSTESDINDFNYSEFDRI